MSDFIPRVAIICYSKTGHSWHVAERLALALDADLFAIQTQRYSFPFFGYMRAGFDSLRGAPAPLGHPLPDIKDHDAVIVCGPVWTSYPAVPLISYLQQETHLPFVMGLMLTCGDHSPPEKAYAKAEQELQRPFVAKAAISNNIEDQPEAETRIKEFARAIRDAIPEKHGAEG
jgi:flavodoxin